MNTIAEDPNLWSDQSKAQGIMRERTKLEQSIEEVTVIEQELEDNITLIELGETEDDESVLNEADAMLGLYVPVALNESLRRFCQVRQIVMTAF